MLQTVIVSLIAPDGGALRGVLWRSRGPWLVLKDATAVRDGHAPEALAGDVIVERRNVAFMEIARP